MKKMRVIEDVMESIRFLFRVEFWIMAVSWSFSLIGSYVQLFLQRLFSRTISYPRSYAYTPMKKPLCIITGATSGLGEACVHALSREGFTVVLVGRSSQRLSKTIADVWKCNKDASLKAFRVDLSSLQSIMHFKDSLYRWLLESDMHASIQLLINNAGILAISSRKTAKGYDEMMATNYVGAFFMTKLLLPLLRNSPVPSRIVNVTSFTHRKCYDVLFDKKTIIGETVLRPKQQYPCARIYQYSKLCMLLFSYELHRRLQLEHASQVSVIAADPGAVKTNIMREVPACLSYGAYVGLAVLGLLQKPENGVHSILDAALAPPEVSGVYFFGGKGRTVHSSAISYNSMLGKELWATSCDLLREAERAQEFHGKSNVS